MPNITIGGKRVDESRILQRFGDELITLIEEARKAGNAEAKIEAMRTWLTNNKDHPLYLERDARYWSVVNARNRAVAEMTEASIVMGRLHQDLCDATVRELSEALEAPFTADFPKQIRETVRKHAGLHIYEVIALWAMDHNRDHQTDKVL